MWLNANLLKINSLPSDMLDFLIYFENLVQSNNWNKPHLSRGAYLTGSPVLYQQKFYGKIQGIATKDYTGVDNLIHDESYYIINRCMESFPNYEILKSELSICPPNTEQQFHIDPRVFHRFSRRIHVPIITNTDAFLEIEDNRYHLKKYEIYEFNNLKPHRSLNLGNSIRAHIIFDIINKDWFNYILKKHSLDLFFKIVKPTFKNNLQNPNEVINSWNTNHDFFNHAFES